MKPHSQILLETHRLLSDPDKWCTGALAKREDGSTCNPCDPEAVKWSVPGACWHISGDPNAWSNVVLNKDGKRVETGVAKWFLAISPSLGPERGGIEITHQAVLNRLYVAYVGSYLGAGRSKITGER